MLFSRKVSDLLVNTMFIVFYVDLFKIKKQDTCNFNSVFLIIRWLTATIEIIALLVDMMFIFLHVEFLKRKTEQHTYNLNMFS